MNTRGRPPSESKFLAIYGLSRKKRAGPESVIKDAEIDDLMAYLISLKPKGEDVGF